MLLCQLVLHAEGLPVTSSGVHDHTASACKSAAVSSEGGSNHCPHQTLLAPAAARLLPAKHALRPGLRVVPMPQETGNAGIVLYYAIGERPAAVVPSAWFSHTPPPAPPPPHKAPSSRACIGPST